MANPPNLYGSGATSDDASRTAYTERKKQGQEEKPKRDPLVARYWREIDRYKKATEAWYQEGQEIVKIYLDELRPKSTGSGKDGQRMFALLFANVETLKPAVYSRIPKVVCSRRFKDKDPVARTASELMERATNTTFELYHVDETFRMVRDDRLLPGRGQAWVRHEAKFDQVPDTGEDGQPAYEEDGKTQKMRDKLRYQNVCVDYVYWEDFGHNVARTWADVWLVWRRTYKTRDEVEERFSAEIAARLSYNAKPPASTTDSSAQDAVAYEAQDDCAVIYELWDKKRDVVSWMAEGDRNNFLETGEPPLDFHDFFPCPEPCFGTKTSKSLTPRPDYVFYRDQAKEINDLTAKIHNLTKWLIVKGFVPAAPSTISDPIAEALTDQSNEALFVQVESMQEWAEKGGAGKLIDWLPIQHIVVALKAAIDARNQLIQDVFQLSGLADILRGQTDPNETLGAQELKAQTGSRRLKTTRDEITRWCRDIAQLCAEVIAEKFDPENIAAITGYKYMPQPPMPAMVGLGGLPGMQQPGAPSGQGYPPSPMPAPAAAPMGMGMPMQTPQAEAADTDAQLVFDDRHIQLLRNDRLRSFRIEVETDESDQANENAEKQARTEALTVVGGYLRDAMPLMMQIPALAPAIKEFLMFVLRAFRAGRSLEDVLERSFDQAIQQAQQVAQRGDPKVAAERAKVQVAQQKAQADVQLTQQKNAADIQLQQQKAAADVQLEQARMATEGRLAEQELATTTMLKAREHAANQQIRQAELASEVHGVAVDRAMTQANADADRALAARNAEADRRVQAEQQRRQKNGGGK